MALSFEDAKSFGIHLFRSLYRYAKAPEQCLGLIENQALSDARWYSPLIYKKAGDYTPPFEALGPYKSIEETLHQLDRREARSRVLSSIQDALAESSNAPQGRGFIYLGRPGNRVEDFALGLCQHVGEHLKQVHMIKLTPSPLPVTSSFEEPSHVREEVNLRIKEAIQSPETQQAFELYRSSRNPKPLILWLDWGYRPVTGHLSDWTNKTICFWHDAARSIFQGFMPESPYIYEPPKLFVTTYGRELPDLSQEKATRNYKESLNKQIFKRNLHIPPFKVEALVQLGDIDTIDISEFLRYAKDIFWVPENLQQRVALVIAQKSKYNYQKAQNLLRQLHEEGAQTFCERFPDITPDYEEDM